MYQVIFFSRSGNTRKIAESIASELGVKALEVKNAKLNPGQEIIFLGSGCYGNKPSPKMMDFIEVNDFQGRKVALFGTSGAGEGKELIDMAETLKEKNASVKGRFYCKGRTFMLINRGHPNTDELTRARKFASEMIKK
jgi:flavodoxin